VVDDAIVMLETSSGIWSWAGSRWPLRSSDRRRSASHCVDDLSLAAVFIPVLFLGGVLGGCSAIFDHICAAILNLRRGSVN